VERVQARVAALEAEKRSLETRLHQHASEQSGAAAGSPVEDGLRQELAAQRDASARLRSDLAAARAALGEASAAAEARAAAAREQLDAVAERARGLEQVLLLRPTQAQVGARGGVWRGARRGACAARGGCKPGGMHTGVQGRLVATLDSLFIQTLNARKRLQVDELKQQVRILQAVGYGALDDGAAASTGTSGGGGGDGGEPDGAGGGSSVGGAGPLEAALLAKNRCVRLPRLGAGPAASRDALCQACKGP
jgi:hypothetical protein